nr:glutathione S-transferase T3-like [Tanacetum cinerariifolium]
PVENDSPLCKAFVAKSEDSVEGNGKKEAGICPKVSQFCEIYNSVQDRHQSGSCDNIVYQEAELEYRTIYNAHFTLTECWKILKDHPKWKKGEMPKFYKSKKSSSKKSRTSENTSQRNSDSAHIGVNLNDEAADSEDVEAQEVPAPMGRDRAKKKGSSSGARSETSIAGDPSLVDTLLSKLTMAATPFFTQRKESSSEYLRIKERELKLEERKHLEQGELERMRIAQREKELDLQQKMFEIQQQQKFRGGPQELLKEGGVLNNKPYKLLMDQNLKLQADVGTPLTDPEVYRKSIRHLIYLTVTRPDICYTV